jgi:hypothetical protein
VIVSEMKKLTIPLPEKGQQGSMRYMVLIVVSVLVIAGVTVALVRRR